LNCPAFRVLVNTQIQCDLRVVSNGLSFGVKIDFNDTDIRSFTLKDTTIKLNKTYKTSGNFYVKANISTELLEIDPIINGIILIYIKI
jgi:hypothetical protein